ncbi:MAG: hypothetical protein AAGC55_15620 [Myxococcota bacterium]
MTNRYANAAVLAATLVGLIFVTAPGCNSARTVQEPTGDDSAERADGTDTPTGTTAEPATAAPEEKTAMTKPDSGINLPIKQRAPATRPARPRAQAAFARSYDGADVLPAVTDKGDLAAHDGTRARVRGTFTEVDVRMRPTKPPQYIGHVSIELADKTRLSLLPIWHADALRPEAEIAALRNKTVEVVGTVRQRAPTDPRGGASPIGPCITDVQAIWPAADAP